MKNTLKAITIFTLLISMTLAVEPTAKYYSKICKELGAKLTQVKLEGYKKILDNMDEIGAKALLNKSEYDRLLKEAEEYKILYPSSLT